MKPHLIISTTNDLLRIAPENIVYIASDGNYSTLVQTDGESHLLSFQLGQVEGAIQKQFGNINHNFIRIGRCLIINRSYINYINVSKQKLVLSNATSFRHELSASHNALKQLKELLEKEAEL
ncbi:MAG: LytTR family DNA-binding domain-containing protein [Muribaculaceae bacterium]|jgi:DNA-binding LytR/AlgR family response regulator|nr:LytTR family DNA-binding domain-containing protein [Muribaculaceae bacterium]